MDPSADDSRLPRIYPDEVWDSYKEEIRELYVVQRKPLNTVRRLFREKYSFNPAPSTWKVRIGTWKFKIKMNPTDYAHALALHDEAKEKGTKRSVFWNKDREITREAIAKYLQSPGEPKTEDSLRRLDRGSQRPSQLTYHDLKSAPLRPLLSAELSKMEAHEEIIQPPADGSTVPSSTTVSGTHNLWNLPAGFSQQMDLRALCRPSYQPFSQVAQQFRALAPASPPISDRIYSYNLMSDTPMAPSDADTPRSWSSSNAYPSNSYSPPQDPESFVEKCLLACALRSHGESEPLVNQAMDEAMLVLEKMIMTDNRQVLTTVIVLSASLSPFGQRKTADMILKKASSVAESHQGHRLPLAEFIAFLGSINAETYVCGSGRIEGVLIPLHQCLVEALGETSPAALAAGYIIAWAFAFEGKHDEAFTRLARLWLDCELVFGSEHIQTTSCAITLARLAQDELHELQYSRETLEKVIRDLRKRLDELHPYLLNARSQLASTIASQGKTTEAEEMLLDIALKQFTALGPHNSRSTVTRRRLEGVLEANGKTAQEIDTIVSGLARDARNRTITDLSRMVQTRGSPARWE